MEYLAFWMFGFVCLSLLMGFPVAFSLAGSALLFAVIGSQFVPPEAFKEDLLLSIPSRIDGLITNTVLIAVPLFIFMGVMLQKSRLAEDMLEIMAQIFGRVSGGLGISVLLVGMLLAASTGIVGATVVTMGLIALPSMLQRGYSPSLASGTIAAAGTLGQIIPPSIVLVLLGDVLGNAVEGAQSIARQEQEAAAKAAAAAAEPEEDDLYGDDDLFGGVDDNATYSAEIESAVAVPEIPSVSPSELFMGALTPGLLLVACYILYLVVIAVLKPSSAPPLEKAQRQALFTFSFIKQFFVAFVPPVLLIVFVLGTIMSGEAAPSEVGAVGAFGAMVLALVRRQLNWTTLNQVMQSTVRMTSMVFLILLGAQLFVLVFKAFGGDDQLRLLLSGLPGGKYTALFALMLLIFLLGFFLDFIEITYVILPIAAPILIYMGIDPLWLGVLIALNLQTSFLTPPFGFSLFYLRGVAPPEVKTGHIYRGAIPFIVIQIVVIAIVVAFPTIATWVR